MAKSRYYDEARTFARLVGESGPLSVWNEGYHQTKTKEKAPVRYRWADGQEPLAWGTGLYAHNPASAGPAFYAVTTLELG